METTRLLDRRAYVVDDDELIRSMLRRMLTGAGIYSEQFASAAAFLDALPKLPVGCILLDLRLPEINGLELLRALKQRGRPDPVIMISGEADFPDAVDAIKTGALDFLQKPFRKDRLLEVIDQAFATVQTIQESGTSDGPAALTRREQEILAALADGSTSKLVGRALGISSRTVEMYRARIVKKLRVQNMVQAIIKAKETGLIG